MRIRHTSRGATRDAESVDRPRPLEVPRFLELVEHQADRWALERAPAEAIMPEFRAALRGVYRGAVHGGCHMAMGM